MKTSTRLSLTSALFFAFAGLTSAHALNAGPALLGIPDEDAYTQGTRAMNAQQWPNAVHDFDEVIAAKSSKRIDAALYWKAYSLNKMSRRTEAVVSCDLLRAKFPTSSWNNDCVALALNLRTDYTNAPLPPLPPLPPANVYGVPAAPGSDADLKMLALNSLINHDPARAIPMLRNILSGDQPMEMKKHAIFVLAQSKSPEATAILHDVVMGKMGAELQRQTIPMVGVFQGKRANDELAEVYRSTQDPQVKRAVVSAFFITQDAPRLVELARMEKDLELKRMIVSQLALMDNKAATDYMLELLR